jgi:hypothetical protein
VLTVAITTTLIGASLVSEAIDLGTRGRADDATRDLGSGELGGCGQNSVAVDDQHGREVHRGAVLGTEEFDMHLLALGHTDLLATGCDHCIHSEWRLYLPRWDQTNAPTRSVGRSEQEIVIHLHTATLAVGALAGEAGEQTLADPLSGHLHETKFGDVEHLRAGLVP